MTSLINRDDSDINYGFVRKLANKTLQKAKIDTPPIILNQIFKSLNEKIIVKGKDLGNEDGFCLNDTTIFYNLTKGRKRNRFTVAHELGHIMLGHNSTTSHFISFGSSEPNEKMANAFAAELLVPARLLKKEMLWNLSLSKLAQKYDVNKEVMMWKLKSNHMDTELASWD